MGLEGAIVISGGRRERSPFARSFIVSLVATASVAVVPTFIVFALIVFGRSDPDLVAAVVLSMLATAGTTAAAASLWARQPESEGIRFGDLMLWSWIRHRHADAVLRDATRVLGYDPTGNFIAAVDASPQERLRALRAIAGALDAKSSYTLGHSRRVTKHARELGEALDVSPEVARDLELAALLHDVGNVGLPEEILRKAGELTVQERSKMEAHVLLGADIVALAGEPAVVSGIRHHHERWIGNGYPDRLAGSDIPLIARVVAIAEAYDAMTSTRPYRQGLGAAAAVAILRDQAGDQFDPELVEKFVSTIGEPVAPRGPAMAGLRGHLRELGLVFKRIGAVALSATASTVAIALILGASVLTPGTAPDADTEVASRGRGLRETDRVLGDRVASDPEKGSESSIDGAPGPVAGGESAAGSDPAIDDPRSGSIQGAVLDPGGHGGGTDPGTEHPSGGGGTDEPDPGTEEPEPGGGTPEPEPGGGATPEPTPTGEEPPAEDGKDKNTDANGNGHANGHDKENGKP